MEVIPVIDLKHGQAVHAIAGKRESYEPIRSTLTESSDPADIAAACHQHLGTQSIYLADIDALEGDSIDWDSAIQVSEHCDRLWYDFGFAGGDEWQAFLKLPNSFRRKCKVILPLESIGSREHLQRAVELASATDSPPIFSLDLLRGSLRGTGDWDEMNSLSLIEFVVGLGIDEILILDLASVGGDSGPIGLELIQQCKTRFPALHLATGGGVRNEADLHSLQRLGCDSVLVATAIHRGMINRASISSCLDANQVAE